ncbi:MAG: hypothetical protein F4008_11180 [Gammaproteobacteria bacterium]|nr:hypothetical protein [Gammaproteobacteria bacterium]MYL14305.1 hypothetical protein [Gammaproteobacteria bacterium]
MNPLLTYAVLKDKQREIRDSFPENLRLRTQRAISWIGRAEQAGDDDGKFIFLWIAFNAAYADERDFQIEPPLAMDSFKSYFGKVVTLDADKRIYNAIWGNFSGPIHQLMKNEFVFKPFWKHQNGMKGYKDWEVRFQRELRAFKQIVSRKTNDNTKRALALVFDRLYVLRNQLVHGGATWDSEVNRNQVRDGAAILAFLIPVFVDVMMSHPGGDWGQPFYPVVSRNSAYSGV